jgi:hypothetical protein
VTAEELHPHLMKLAPRERVRLAYELLNSVHAGEVAEYDAAMEAAWGAEMEGQTGSVSLVDVLAEMDLLYPDDDPEEHRRRRNAPITAGEEISRSLDEHYAESTAGDEIFARTRALVKELERQRALEEEKEAP